MFPSPHIFEPTTSHFPFKIIPQFFPSLDAFNKSLTNLCVSHKRSTKVYYINQRIWISHIRQIFSKNRDGRPSEYIMQRSALHSGGSMFGVLHSLSSAFLVMDEEPELWESESLKDQLLAPGFSSSQVRLRWLCACRGQCGLKTCTPPIGGLSSIS